MCVLLLYVTVCIRSISQEIKAFYFEVHHSTLKGQWECGKGISWKYGGLWILFSLLKTVLLFSWKKNCSFVLFYYGQTNIKQSGQGSSKGKGREGIQSRMRAFSLLLKEKYCTWIFLSYADLFLDCCVSLILRREVFFLITHENSIFCLKTVRVHKKELLICEHWNHSTESDHRKATFFFFGCCKVRICGAVYKVIVYFMKIFLYNKILMADKLKIACFKSNVCSQFSLF